MRRVWLEIAFIGLCLIWGCAIASRGVPQLDVPDKQKETSIEADAAGATGPPWIHNDYERALKRAKQEDKPLLVDFWAGWCPMCVYMNQYILNDPGLRGLYDHFIWASIDTDRLENGQATERFGIRFWPSYFVVNPAGESIEGRRHELMSVNQFRHFLLSSKNSFTASKTNPVASSGNSSRLLRDGDRKMTAKDWKGAIFAYSESLKNANPDWPDRSELISRLISAYFLDGDWSGCVELALREMDHMPHDPNLLTLLDFGNRCSAHLASRVKLQDAFLDSALPVARSLLTDPHAGLSVLDRINAMELEKSLCKQRGDAKRAEEITRRQKILLDQAMDRAPIPWAKMAFVGAQINVYVELGMGAELIPKLIRLAEALPRDMGPPYQLAKLYLKLGQPENGLIAAETALELAPDTRIPFVHYLIAKAHKNIGNPAAQKDALNNTVRTMNALPESLRAEKLLRMVEEELTGMNQ